MLVESVQIESFSIGNPLNILSLERLFAVSQKDLGVQ